MQLSGVPIHDKYQHSHPSPYTKRPSDPVPAESKNRKRRKTRNEELEKVDRVAERPVRSVNLD